MDERRKLTKLFVIILVIVPISLAAQKANKNWHEGVVVLKNNEVLKGSVKFHQQLEIVQCKKENMVKTFSAHDIQSFRFYDEEKAFNRRFNVVSINFLNGRNGNFIFESIKEGQIQVLRREKKYLAPVANIETSVFPSKELKKQALNFNYYLKKENEVILLDNFKAKMWKDLIKDYPDKLINYKKNHQLALSNPDDCIYLVEYYNHLKNPSYKPLQPGNRQLNL